VPRFPPNSVLSKTTLHTTHLLRISPALHVGYFLSLDAARGCSALIPRPSPGKIPASSRAGFYGWEADPCCTQVYSLHAARIKSLACSLLSRRLVQHCFSGSQADPQIPGSPKTEERYKHPRINTNRGNRAAEDSRKTRDLTPL
jgi:hypothetical protein